MKKAVLISTLAILIGSYFVLLLASGYLKSEERKNVVGRDEDSLDAFSKKKKFIDVEGTRVAYIDEGEGDPVILIHGCPFHAYEWRKTIPALTEKYRVIAPDLLGLGDTQVTLEQDYRLPKSRDMVIGLMDALGIERAHIVGHDHGGATLQLMMNSHPERIRTATLTNVEAYDQWPSKPELKYLIATQNAFTNPIFWGLLHSETIAAKVFSIATFNDEALTKEDVYAFTRAHITTPDRWKRLQRFFRWQLDPEHNQVTMAAVDGMRKFNKPTLILWGKQDTNFGPELAERLANDIPGTVGIHYLENSSHLPMLEESDAFNKHLLDFLGTSEKHTISK